MRFIVKAMMVLAAAANERAAASSESSATTTTTSAAAAPGKHIVQKRTWNIQHALVSDEDTHVNWQPRGEATLTVLQEGEDKGAPLEIELTVENAHNWTSEWIDQLATAPWYQLQFTEEKASSDMPPITTTVPSCMLRRSNFRYVIAFILILCDCG
jgi:hypothetical protein